MKKQQWNYGIVGAMVALGLASCANGASSQSPGAAGSGGSASVDGGTTGNVSIGAGGSGTIDFSSSNGAGGGTGSTESCVGQTSKAETVPLDMYIMLDKSGSMLEKTGLLSQGIPKWDAVTTALEAFFQDPQSAGIGVGLQYFPTRKAGVPDSCLSNAECGASGGPCLLRTCTDQGSIVSCDSDQDCPFLSSCEDLGQCSNDPSTYCLPVGAACQGGKGTCVDIISSYCINAESCAAADYSNPAVEIRPLGFGNAVASLIESIHATTPEGATPTGPALQGAIHHARSHVVANPTHTVVAVLATDGLPTECDPQAIGSIATIAANGASGSPSVRTFVIGVFSGNNTTAQNNLNQIAAAGGTQQAYFIDSNQNVTQGFLDALNAIRGTKLACEYTIPAAPAGDTLDYAEVNIEHSGPGEAQSKTIYYVESAAGCDPMTGGWYYDANPVSGGAPTKIMMCPETCTAFSAGGQVDIRLGCKTEIPPLK